MSTRHAEFLTKVWIPEEVFFVNCYSHWDKFVETVDEFPDRFVLGDHMFGFRQDGSNRVLDVLDQSSQKTGRTWTVISDQLYPRRVHDKYPNIKLEFNIGLFERYGATVRMPPRHEYPTHPDHDFQNFLCSFNGRYALSRRLLLSALKKFNWFNPKYVSKHSVWEPEELDGLIIELAGDKEVFYRKFFAHEDREFSQLTNSFGYLRGMHDVNIHNLDSKITQSFVHLVSETIATSSVPFVTEKAFYSIITRGLFVTYGQPGWQKYMTEIFGFQSYHKLFDYRYDDVEHPLQRLIDQLCMLSKYANLSKADWHDLHQLEIQAIEFNYEHFRSGDYIRSLDKYSQENLYY